jgi:hypothetical protein
MVKGGCRGEDNSRESDERQKCFEHVVNTVVKSRKPMTVMQCRLVWKGFKMKQWLAKIGLFFVSLLSVHGRGYVNFNTEILGSSAMVYVQSVPASNGLYLAQLYAADGFTTLETTLAAVGLPVNFRGGNFAGYVQTAGTTTQGNVVNPAVQVTTQTSGVVTLQLRVWNSAFSSYADAIISGNSGGRSQLLTMSPGYVPDTPQNLSGFQGFGTVGALAPEPSTFALLGVGLGAVFITRRKR